MTHRLARSSTTECLNNKSTMQSAVSCFLFPLRLISVQDKERRKRKEKPILLTCTLLVLHLVLARQQV